MRSVLATALLALPMVASAQAMHSVSHLVASVDAPAFAFQAGAINAAKPRVFTGLIAPVRLGALKVAPAVAPFATGKVDVEFTVDAAGVPQDVHAVKAPDAVTAERVVSAVKNVRYTPGTLNGQAIAVPVTMHVDLQN